MNGEELVFLYSTFPDSASAQKVGEALVEAGLAACVNLYPAVTSIYEWEGKLEVASEVAVFIKTRLGLAEAAMESARTLHPYTVPCFLILPILGGNDDYVAWAHAQMDGN
jgi:periplasmic divalent cation tolerance protein